MTFGCEAFILLVLGWLVLFQWHWSYLELFNPRKPGRKLRLERYLNNVHNYIEQIKWHQGTLTRIKYKCVPSKVWTKFNLPTCCFPLCTLVSFWVDNIWYIVKYVYSQLYACITKMQLSIKKKQKKKEKLGT